MPNQGHPVAVAAPEKEESKIKKTETQANEPEIRHIDRIHANEKTRPRAGLLLKISWMGA